MTAGPTDNYKLLEFAEQFEKRKAIGSRLNI